MQMVILDSGVVEKSPLPPWKSQGGSTVQENSVIYRKNNGLSIRQISLYRFSLSFSATHHLTSK